MELITTEISKKAKERLTALTSKIPDLAYNPQLVEEVMGKDNEIDFEKILSSLSRFDHCISFLEKCVQLNLNEEQAHEIIKLRYIKENGPEVFKNKESSGNLREQVKESYLSWCDYLEIKPDSKFPNW